MKMTAILGFLMATLALTTGCAKGSNTPVADVPATPVAASTFDADSAYAYVAAQIAFGPRVPGSEAHTACAAMLASELQRHGAIVTVSDTVMRSTDGSMKAVRNISGRFRPDARRYIMLLAHYDTRPTADQDPDEANRDKPFDGANDGASGVGILLEIARHADELPENTGLEILFVDTEDSGNYSDDASWCLGSQAFATAMPPLKPRPAYAILLDMVGAKDATFSKEFFSNEYAPEVNAKIWNTAARIGHGKRFINSVGGAINDDHVHLLGIGIPAVDIIEMQHPATGSFNPTWHTMADNMDNISAETLRAVGETVLETIKTK